MTHNTGSALLTIAELARILDLPESTTRYYCNRFADHLPSVGEGRRRRFKPEALEVLRTIAGTMRRDKNAFAVDLALRNGDCTVTAQAAAPVPAQRALPGGDPALAASAVLAKLVLSLMEYQSKALQDIASAMGVFAERLSVTPAVQGSPVREDPSSTSPAAGDGGGQEDASLRREIISLRKQIMDSESVHQNDLEQLRKWLTRLGEALASK